MLFGVLLFSAGLLASVEVAPVRASLDVYQGDLLLQGNNVTTVEGRFDINGSIIVEGNSTLVLRNAALNFTQSKNYQYNLTLQNPSNGLPRLLVDNATITSSNYWFRVNFFGNGTVDASKFRVDSRVQPWAHDKTTVTVRSANMSQFYTSAWSNATFYDSGLSECYVRDNSSLQLINSTWAQTLTIENQSKAMIGFYLDVRVIDSATQNVSGALITATFSGQPTNWTASTASNGWARLILWQRMKNASGDTFFPGYNVEAAYASYRNTTTVNMTGNQQITIGLGFVVPEFSTLPLLFLLMTATVLAATLHKRRKVLLHA